MSDPYYPQPNGPEPGQIGQPSSGQPLRPPKPPKAPGDGKPKWPWVIGGLFIVLVLIIGIVANAGDDETAQNVGASSSRAAATSTMSADEFKRQSEARAAEAERQRQAAEAERQRVAAIEAARMDRSTYEVLGERDFALLAKNPDASKGRKIVVYGVVTQFDSATGTTTFRADTAAGPSDRSYDYDQNTVVTGARSLLANVVEDDLLTMYVEVLGSYSYETQIGGNTTVPQLQANIIDVTGSAN
ncbi:DUF2510 domain-containing protein [Rhodococcus sp. NPDC057014]|uniref:DUF2510 domain-containing protein n=1 Tax=Rhodococcus sp. NPDC057014 TaxID=3346000 RepID=UPI003639181D